MPSTPASTETYPLRIIVIEDNVEANNLLRDWLTPHYPVECYFDAESTLRLVRPGGGRIVFLIDYNLPGDNGIVLKQKLLPRFPNAKYILVSGLFEEKLTAAARGAGFDALLPKPFGMPMVTQKIEAMLGLPPKETLTEMVKRQTGSLPRPRN
jgi:DNA-binding response OmpR family regulator